MVTSKSKWMIIMAQVPQLSPLHCSCQVSGGLKSVQTEVTLLASLCRPQGMLEHSLWNFTSRFVTWSFNLAPLMSCTSSQLLRKWSLGPWQLFRSWKNQLYISDRIHFAIAPAVTAIFWNLGGIRESLLFEKNPFNLTFFYKWQQFWITLNRSIFIWNKSFSSPYHHSHSLIFKSVFVSLGENVRLDML